MMCGMAATLAGCGADDDGGAPGTGGAGTGDTSVKPGPPVLAALAFTVLPGGGVACPASGTPFSLPAGSDALQAIRTTAGENRTTGETYRVTDGDAGIEASCTVRGANDGTFQLEATLRKQNVVTFTASGTLAPSGGTITVSEWDSSSGVASAMDGRCELSLTDRYIADGAIWADLTCPELDGEGVRCAAEGTLLFENCAR
jgi:hypothetical protein